MKQQRAGRAQNLPSADFAPGYPGPELAFVLRGPCRIFFLWVAWAQVEVAPYFVPGEGSSLCYLLSILG